ncbi:MAG: GGDEF domain-containing protein [Alphaproteobacteria bacterium]|nr:GGDEF domain-containing protein [Alphaproteobacteria bacterium]
MTTGSLKHNREAGGASPKGEQLVALLKHSLTRLEGAAGGEWRGELEQALELAEQAQREVTAARQRILRLESLLATDELTGLLNRRGLIDHMGRMLAMADRHGGRGVIAYIDLDGFKAINDRLGHAAGDAVLQRVAEILGANTRAADVVARIGGDEFVALLVQSGWRWGQSRARQLQRMVNRSFARYDVFRIPLRVSLGVETYRPGDDPEDLLRRSDEAMYTDKRDRATLVHIATARIARELDAGTVVIGIPVNKTERQ